MGMQNVDDDDRNHQPVLQKDDDWRRWEFMEAGKARLAGDTKRQASSGEVEQLRQENEQLKQLVAELALKNQVLNMEMQEN